MNIGNLKPIKKIKIHDQVIRAMQDIVLKGNLKPGDRLPSEYTLSKKLGVGTRSIREALKMLEAQGLVEIKQGVGVFILSNRLDHFLESLADSLRYDLADEMELLLELTSVRRIIEASIIAEVAEKRTEEDLEKLREIIKQMSAEVHKNDIDQYNKLDTLFHRQIIQLNRNRILISLYSNIYNLLQKSIHETGYIQRNLAYSMEEHLAIFDCIEQKQGTLAGNLIAKHLAHTEASLREQLAK